MENMAYLFDFLEDEKILMSEEEYMMAKEEWRDIPGFENLYRISTFGNIISYGRNGNGFKDRKLKQYIDRYGYMKVVLHKNNKPHYFSVHRLVALTFIKNVENKPQVNHIDNNPLNNNVDNLEWVTNKENLYHSHRQKRQKWNAKIVKSTNLESGQETIFESMRECSRAFGCSLRTIQRKVENQKTLQNCLLEVVE